MESHAWVWDVLPMLLIAAITAIGASAAWARSSLKRLIEANVQGKALSSALLWLNDIAWTVVADAEQTAVRELKRQAAEGPMTPAQYRLALQQVKDDSVRRVKSLTLGRLTAATALDHAAAGKLIESKVEAAVLAQKPGAAAGPLPSPPQG